MEKMTNLLDFITKTDDEIAFYLKEVHIDQFKKDIQFTFLQRYDVKLIEDAIFKLQNLLK